jgi:hypothetical protein
MNWRSKPRSTKKLILLAEQLIERLEQNTRDNNKMLDEVKEQLKAVSQRVEAISQQVEVVRVAQGRIGRGEIGLPVDNSFGAQASRFIGRLIETQRVSDEAARRFKKQMCH